MAAGKQRNFARRINFEYGRICYGHVDDRFCSGAVGAILSLDPLTQTAN